MKERRSLIEGLKETPPVEDTERAFVYGDRPAARPIEASPEAHADKHTPAETKPPSASKVLPQMTGRVPVTARCRTDIASNLKRASLERQLAGVEPYYTQDIIEQALEHWLTEHGYLANE
ncbi:MAG: hypothetical protein R3C19_25335 [Planctomycetaceae bacterium]